MKIYLEIEYTEDGKVPDAGAINAILSQFTAGYIGSESVDGSSDWGITINSVSKLDTYSSTHMTQSPCSRGGRG